MSIRTRYVATYYYPGVLFPEETTRDLAGWTFSNVLESEPNDGWYGVVLTAITEEVLESPEYGETMVVRDRDRRNSWIVGKAYHYSDIPGNDKEILRSNIRNNDKQGGYGVLTRCGNWQIRSDWDCLVDPAELELFR